MKEKENDTDLTAWIGLLILTFTFAIGMAFGMFIMKHIDKKDCNQIEVVKNN